MMIENDVWVTVRYRLFDSLGDALEPTERELTYLQGGYGTVFPSIEEALAGHGVGYATRVHLEPEESFGDYDPELVRLASREQFPDDLEVGMTFEGVPGEDDADDEDDEDGRLYIVTDMTDEAVVLDANHPLAGMSLRFDIRVVDVRAASAEEVERERALVEDAQAQDDRESPLRRVVVADDDFDDDEDIDDDGPDRDDDHGPGHDEDLTGPARRRLH
jgi:FKBP-type peptidyl-prolyl cis-trans isomerase SlyD